jgi:CheY-like chemotaxis protein
MNPGHVPAGTWRPEVARSRMHRGLNLQGLRILVVDDHEDTLEMMRMLVASFGAKVDVAQDGRQALRLARRKRPDAILTDLAMPRMDGLELVRRLRADPALSRVPVLAVSGRNEDADFMESCDAGFDGHLVKPITRQILESQLARIFGGRAQPPQQG